MNRYIVMFLCLLGISHLAFSMKEDVWSKINTNQEILFKYKDYDKKKVEDALIFMKGVAGSHESNKSFRARTVLSSYYMIIARNTGAGSAYFLDQAAEWIRPVAEQNKNLGRALSASVQLGQIYERMKNTQEAKKWYKKVIDIDIPSMDETEKRDKQEAQKALERLKFK